MITLAAPQAGQVISGRGFRLSTRARHGAIARPVAAVNKAIRPCPSKSPRQHMEHEQGEEVLGRDGSDPVYSSFGMVITEGDHAVLELQNILLAVTPLYR